MKAVQALLRTILLVAGLIFLLRIHTLLGLAGLAAYIIWWAASYRAGIYAYRGNLKYQQGKLEEAAALLQKAAVSKGTRAAYLIGGSFMLLKLGRLNEAEAMMQRARQMPMSREEEMALEQNESMLLWKLGRLPEAITKLEKVYEDYKTTNTYITLGYYYILSGDLDRALDFNREAYTFNGSSTVIMDNLGQTLHLRGENEEALALYQKVSEQRPTFPEAYYNYAQVLAALGRPVEALEQARRALEHPLSLLSALTKEEIEELIRRLEAEAGAETGAETGEEAAAGTKAEA